MKTILAIFTILSIHFPTLIKSRFIYKQSRTKRYSPVILPPSYTPYNVPPNSIPYLPSDPFHHQFGLGYEHNDGLTKSYGGNFRFTKQDPLTRQIYPWELEGVFNVGWVNEAFTFGESVNNVNPHKLPVADTYWCTANPGLCGNYPTAANGQPQQIIVVVAPTSQPAVQSPVEITIKPEVPPLPIESAPVPVTEKPARRSPVVIYGTRNTHG